MFAASGEVARNRTYAPKDCVKPRVRPSRIVLACGDFGLDVSHIDWHGWTQRRAHGKGKLYANTCDPSCSAGNFKKYPVHVHLRKVRRRTCGGLHVPLFRKAILRFPGKRPSVRAPDPQEHTLLPAVVWPATPRRPGCQPLAGRMSPL